MSGNLNLPLVAVFSALCLLLSPAWGDSLQLRNGSLIKGTFLGGTGDEISFQVGSREQRYALADIVSVSFDDEGRTYPSAESQPLPAPPQPEPGQSLPTSGSGDTVKVPSGTRIVIRTVDAIDSNRNQVGDKFQASIDHPACNRRPSHQGRGAAEDLAGSTESAAETGQVRKISIAANITSCCVQSLSRD